ncbi:MAG: type II toxin-antitoxin system HicB family antitoxin [Nitrospirota bacterium]
MNNTIKVYISEGEKYYIAQCVEIDVVTQGETINQVIENIKEAIDLHLEGEDLAQYNLSPKPTMLITMELDYAKAV